LQVELRPDPQHEESYLAYSNVPVIDDDGNLYVLDNNSSRIVVYHPDGTYSQTIGRLGSGPGDLNYPTDLWYRDELLYVSQGTPLRLSRFKPDGSLVDVTTRYEIPSAGIVPEIDLTEDGHLLLHLRSYQKEDRLQSVALKVVVLSSRDDTLAVLSTSSPMEADPLHVQRGVRAHPVPFSSVPSRPRSTGRGRGSCWRTAWNRYSAGSTFAAARSRRSS
jgi:hypothetical protein